jgi:hypothetical protein
MEGIEEMMHRVWRDLCSRIHSSVYLLLSTGGDASG